MENIPVVLPLYSYIIIAIVTICQYSRMTKHNLISKVVAYLIAVQSHSDSQI